MGFRADLSGCKKDECGGTPKKRVVFVLGLAFLALCPSVASSQSIVLSEAGAYHNGIPKVELTRFRELFDAALRKAGASVHTTKGKLGGAKNAEFVTSLSIGRAGEEYVLTAQVSRIRLDQWSSRAEVRASASDEATVSGAIERLAAEVSAAARGAPPRSAAQPPRKPREKRTARAAPAAEPELEQKNDGAPAVEEPADAEEQ